VKRILVGLDGSPHERRILDAAVKLASALDGKLVLFHAVNLPTTLPPAALTVTPDEVGAMLAREAEQHLRALAGELGAGLVERVQVEVGVPWRAVCEAAAQDAADLIVVGSHGYGGIDHLIGTTAAKIVNHARCAVLVERTPL
jgi:nucleotide-binding universal stress UspA family protein